MDWEAKVGRSNNIPSFQGVIVKLWNESKSRNFEKQNIFKAGASGSL